MSLLPHPASRTRVPHIQHQPGTQITKNSAKLPHPYPTHPLIIPRLTQPPFATTHLTIPECVRSKADTVITTQNVPI